MSRETPELAANGDTGRASALAEIYLARARETAGQDSLEYATVATWLGWLYKQQQRYVDAEQLLASAPISPSSSRA